MNQPGDIVNGHVLTMQGTWEPQVAQAVEAEVERRMSNAKTNAWLLWFFLGGVNAHLGYIYPKQRWVIIGISTVVALMTLGLSSLACLITWAFLIGDGQYVNRRNWIRTEVEREFATRKALYA